MQRSFRTCCIICYLRCDLQASPGFWRFSGEFAVGGAAQGNALSADLEEENRADEAPQEEEKCFPSSVRTRGNCGSSSSFLLW